MKNHIVICTTVAETLATILKGQPKRLSDDFIVSLVSSPHGGTHDVNEGTAVNVHRVAMARGIHPLRDVVSLVRMTLVFIRLRPDIVHSYTPKAGLVCMVAAFLARVPIRVHTFTGLIFPTAHGILRRVLICVDRVICACATHVVPEGKGVARDLVQFDITRKQLDLIGHGNIAGVDTAFFSRSAPGICECARLLRESLAVPGDRFVFCYVGRLNRDKGLTELLAAFQSLPETAHLILAGDLDVTAPIPEEALTLIRSHERISWLGFLNDVRPALACSQVLILPSYREGFPNVVLQAGAMELPAIVTDINGSNEIIEPGLNGWVVPAHTIEPLAAAMRDAMASSVEVLSLMGINARRRVEERFERSGHWSRLVQFYNKLLSS